MEFIQDTMILAIVQQPEQSDWKIGNSENDR